MKFLKKHMLIILFLGLVNCISFIAINYIIGNSDVMYPYGLSGNNKSYDCKSTNTSKNFDFLLKYPDIIVIAETSNSEYVGIYDPTMFLYINSTKFTDTKNFRYFSMQDYNNKKNVGIAIDSINEKMYAGNLDIDINVLQKGSDFTVINVFGNDSLIASQNPNLKAAKNLFALQYESVTRLYVDAEDHNILSDINSNLLKMGFHENSHNKISILKAIYDAFSGKKYVIFILNSLIFVYLLLIYISIIYSKSFFEFWELSLSLGGTTFQIIRNFTTKFLFVAIITSFISAMFVFRYLSFISKSFTDIMQYVEIAFILILTTLIIYYICYSFFIIRLKRKMR